MKTQDAINHFGSKTKLCEALGLCRMNAHFWGYWLPEKHAQNLFFKHGFEYNKDLYSGKEVFSNSGKSEYVACPWVSSITMLEKEMKKGTRFFFLVDGKFYREEKAMEIYDDSLIYTFRECPIYQKVTTCS